MVPLSTVRGKDQVITIIRCFQLAMASVARSRCSCNKTRYPVARIRETAARWTTWSGCALRFFSRCTSVLRQEEPGDDVLGSRNASVWVLWTHSIYPNNPENTDAMNTNSGRAQFLPGQNLCGGIANLEVGQTVAEDTVQSGPA